MDGAPGAIQSCIIVIIIVIIINHRNELVDIMDWTGLDWTGGAF